MKGYQKFTWKFLQLTAGIIFKKVFNMKMTEENPEPDEGYILLANHAHHIDAFFIASFLKRPLHYLGSDEIATLVQQILADLTGMIYTQKGTIDPSAVRTLLKLVRSGDSIGIYPEGDGTWDGQTDTLYVNIIKLVKRFKVPLRLVVTRGAYLTRPRWADVTRRGKITMEFKTLTKEEIAGLSEQELFDRIVQYLYNNDIKYHLEHDIRFKTSKAAGGIQYLLWKCPVCMTHDRITGRGNTITCKACNETWKTNGNMQVIPELNEITDLKDWSDWQQKAIDSAVTDTGDEQLTASQNICVEILERTGGLINKRKKIFKKYADGELVLYKDALVFNPDKKSKPQLKLPIDEITNYIDCVNHYFLVYTTTETYKIDFNKKNSSRYIHFLRKLHALKTDIDNTRRIKVKQ